MQDFFGIVAVVTEARSPRKAGPVVEHCPVCTALLALARSAAANERAERERRLAPSERDNGRAA